MSMVPSNFKKFRQDLQDFQDLKIIRYPGYIVWLSLICDWILTIMVFSYVRLSAKYLSLGVSFSYETAQFANIFQSDAS